jgi:4-carboxymuconolactone decarboxylase
MTEPRIPLPDADQMTPAQRAVLDRILTGPRGRLIGPLRAAMHNPALADRWQALGQVLRYETCLPPRLNELAILAAARHWNSELEWTIHAAEARRAGLSEAVIAAMLAGAVPPFATPDEREIYEFARALLQDGLVTDATYDAVLARWGALGVVELTALVGYYSMVAMTLNAHRIPLPDHIPPELNPTATTRTTLPAAQPA